MKKARIKLEDGRIAKFDVPDDATEADVMAYIAANPGMFAPVSDDFDQASGNIQQGTEPAPLPKSHRINPESDDILTPFMKGATGSLSDEAIGGVAASTIKVVDIFNDFMRKLKGEEDMSPFPESEATFRENYETARDDVRAEQDAFAYKHPGANLAAELTGAVTTGGYLGAKSLPLLTSKGVPRLAALSATAGAEGALFGFGEGEGAGESFEKAGASGLTSMIAAPVVDKLARMVATPIAKRLNKTKAKGIQEQLTPSKSTLQLKDEAQAFYAAADNAGVKVKGAHFNMWKRDMLDYFEKYNIDAELYPPIGKAIRRMTRLESPTYGDINSLKTALENARKSGDPAIARIANRFDADINEFIEKLTPMDVIAGNVDDLGQTLKKARNLWSRKSQAEVIEEMVDRADISDVALKGDMDQAIQNEIRSLLNSKRRRFGMDDEVLEGLRDIIKGGTAKKITRFFGRMAPGSHTARAGTPTIVGGLAGLSAGGTPGAVVGSAAPSVVGGGFKQLASFASDKELGALKHALVNRDQLKVEKIIDALIEKYPDIIGGMSAALTASQSSPTKLKDLTASLKEQGKTLADLMVFEEDRTTESRP